MDEKGGNDRRFSSRKTFLLFIGEGRRIGGSPFVFHPRGSGSPIHWGEKAFEKALTEKGKFTGYFTSSILEG